MLHNDDYKLSNRGCGSHAFPDIRTILEKPNSPVLSAEAHAKFRRVLGKLAWFAQTREDLHIAISLVSVRQSAPTAAHEEALRAILRFLPRDGDARVHFPSPDAVSEDSYKEVSVFSDASYAPMRSLGRKSITGRSIPRPRGGSKIWNPHFALTWIHYSLVGPAPLSWTRPSVF